MKTESRRPQQAPMRGPGPGRGPGGSRTPMKLDASSMKTLKRLLAYVFRRFGLHYLLVIGCILVTAWVGVQLPLFLQTLIDDHISPLLLEAVPTYDGLLREILRMAGICTCLRTTWGPISR